MKSFEAFVSILLLIMFFLSGIHKIFNFNSTVDSLKSKVTNNFDNYLYQLAIVIVIILEIVAPLIIIYHFLTETGRMFAIASIVGLIVFTIVVTWIYHPPDFTNYMKSLPFWSNTSLLAGLLLLANRIIL